MSQIVSLVLMSLLLAPVCGHAQTKNSTPAPLGWGSSWTEPANEKQRQRRELVRQYDAAEKAGKYEVAADLCSRWLQHDRNDLEIYANRAGAYWHFKRYEPALADMEQARKISEGKGLRLVTAKLWLLSAQVHQSMKAYPAEVSDLQAALKLNAKDTEALNNLAWLRATSPDGTLRDGRESIRLARKAVGLAPAGQSYTLEDTLAAGYAESADFAQAVECEKRASKDAEKQIRDATKAGVFLKGAADRLRLFEQHQAYHADPL